MGSRNDKGERLPAETYSGAGREVPAEAPGGPPPESAASHVTLKMTELKRLLHPTSGAK